jgi:hypothetical protein
LAGTKGLDASVEREIPSRFQAINRNAAPSTRRIALLIDLGKEIINERLKIVSIWDPGRHAF